MKKIISLILIALATTACSLFPNYDLAGMFKSSAPSTNERFQVSMQWNEANGYRSIPVENDYNVYICGDTHVDSTTHNLEKFMLAYRSDSTAPFAIHVGDLINAQGNYPRFHAALSTAPTGYVRRPTDTVFITAGNHDIYFGQWREYVQYYHTSTYWFETVSKADPTKRLDLFISIDSSDGSLQDKQLKWLESLLAERSQMGYRHIIVFTHTNVFKQDASQGHCSNYTMEETYALTGLMSRYGVEMFINGHDHSREITHYGGTQYVTLDALQDPEESPSYMKLQVGNHLCFDFIVP